MNITPGTRPLNILFLCTGNSARSILAEATMNALGAPRFRAFSAGSRPTGQVNPLAADLLRKHGIATEGARSKSWDEFAAPGAPELDLIITVCDSAAGEACPYWPGRPVSAHWGVADPAAVEGTIEARRKAFFDAYLILRRRIELLLALPVSSLDRADLTQRLKDIGER